MSLNVVAVIVAKPGSEDTVRAALLNLVGPTREEAGNISYELSESVSAPGTFVTIEEWSDPSDLDQHLQTPHVQTALSLAGEHLAAAPAIHPLTPVSDS